MRPGHVAMWGRIFLSISAAIGFAGVAAAAEDIAAGKTPAQIFNSDCSECHHTPTGLAKGRDASALASFLVEHYTTKPEYARAMAAYVVSFAVIAPPPPTRRNAALPALNGENRPADAERIRPPEPVATTPGRGAREASRSAGPTPNRRSETVAPLEAISSYLGSILSGGSAKPAGAKPGGARVADIKGHPKPHRHRQDTGETRGGPRQEPKATTAPATAAEPNEKPAEPPAATASAANSDEQAPTAVSPPSSSRRPLHRHPNKS